MMDWKLIYSVAKDLVLVALFIYTVWSNRAKVTARRFAALETQVGERVTAEALRRLEEERETGCRQHDQRTRKIELEIERIETELKYLPTSRDYAEIKGQLENINGTLSGLRRAVDLMNTHLISQGGKS